MPTLTPSLRIVYVSSLVVDEIKRIIKSSEILKYVLPNLWAGMR